MTIPFKCPPCLQLLELPLNDHLLNEVGIKQVHLGYLLASQFWRQGFASEVLGQCMSWLGESCRVVLVFVGVSAENIASKQLLLKLGFSVSSQGSELYLFEIKPN